MTEVNDDKNMLEAGDESSLPVDTSETEEEKLIKRGKLAWLTG